MSDSQFPSQTPNPEIRQWAMFCHFAAFFGLIFPFGNLLGPLIIWQLKKDTDPFIDAQGKESLNFQITATIAGLISMLLVALVVGVLLLLVVGFGAMALTVIAGIKANGGLAYRYPFTWRVIK